MGEVKQRVAEAARTRWGEGLARWGLVSKGSLYVLVGLVAAHVAVGGGERLQDRGGALSEAADHWLGKPLVLALAVGLAGYAAWRFAEGILGRTLEGGEDAEWYKRIGYFARGFWYVGLLAVALSALRGSGAGKGGEEDRFTARVFDLPGGRLIIAAIGLGVLAAGAFNLWRGATAKFRESLKTRKMGETEERAFTGIGIVGHVARGVVFALIGFFLVRAAWQYDAKEAVGLDGALAKLLQRDFGDTLLGVVAAGLLAYGIYCYVEARYREV